MAATATGTPPLSPLKVGVVAVEMAGAMARWTNNQFHVPPALDGAGFVRRFLDAVLRYLKDKGRIQEVRVTILDPGRAFEDPRPSPDPANRA